jgi:hypothetical protein
MPRYFFDVDTGFGRLHDDMGVELADDHAARDEATKALTAIGKDHIGRDDPDGSVSMWVRDEHDVPMLHLELSLAVKQLIG